MYAYVVENQLNIWFTGEKHINIKRNVKSEKSP